VKRTLLHRGLIAATALCTLGTVIAGVAPAAHAATVTQIVAGGSDTIQNVSDPILADAQSAVNGTTIDGSPVSIATTNMHAAVGAGQADLTYSIPASPQCAGNPAGAINYTTNSAPPSGTFETPNGSGQGLSAMVAAEAGNYPNSGAGHACISIGRSSNGPAGATTDGSANLVFNAFALDAVSWSSPSIYAPATLTQTQLIGIYSCTFTDWGQVGGIAGHAIQRYMPQASSGTGKFFVKSLLNGLVIPGASGAPAGSTFACPAVINTQLDNSGKPLEENTGNELDAAGYQTAILPYSVGQWVFQANSPHNPTIDLRNGVRIGGITPTGSGAVNYLRWNTSGVWEPNSVNGANPNAPINEVQTAEYVALNSAPATVYPGIRYVWYILDTANPNFDITTAMVGFNNVAAGAKSSLCNNGERGNLVSDGFSPLPNTTNTNTNKAGSTCRNYGA
jgi:ABC-type phosphate transport system substrate-binding protein